jgi:hypothetical protein
MGAEGVRAVEEISLGDLTEVFPPDLVDVVIGKAGVRERRKRLLPARLMVYFLLGRALFCPDPYREVLRKLAEPLRRAAGWGRWRIPDKAAVFRARQKLGEEPLRELLAQVGPVAEEDTPGAFWRGHRLMVVDGTVLEAADSAANAEWFGRPRNRAGQTVAYPQLRVAVLIESGTHIVVDAEVGTYHTGEVDLSVALVRSLRPGMLLLADRGFPGVRWWKQMTASGADLMCRVQRRWNLKPERVLEDGSWISTVHIRVQKGRPNTNRESITVRVIEYRLDDPGRDRDQHYRLVTTLMDPLQAPAAELAALYAERWEAENTLAELKTSQIGTDRVLNSKSPELVRQEVYAHLAVHAALRKLMWRTAVRQDDPLDPDRLSFSAALRAVRRSVLASPAVFPPSGPGPQPRNARPRAPGGDQPAPPPSLRRPPDQAHAPEVPGLAGRPPQAATTDADTHHSRRPGDRHQPA